MKQNPREEFVNYYHVDVKKDIPCSRMTKFDKYNSRYVPAHRDFSYHGFTSFTDDVLKGKIQVTRPLNGLWFVK